MTLHQASRLFTIPALFLVLCLAFLSTTTTARSMQPTPLSDGQATSTLATNYVLEGDDSLTMKITGPNGSGNFELELSRDGRPFETGTLTWSFFNVFYFEVGSATGTVIVLRESLVFNIATGPKAGTQQVWLKV